MSFKVVFAHTYPSRKCHDLSSSSVATLERLVGRMRSRSLSAFMSGRRAKPRKKAVFVLSGLDTMDRAIRDRFMDMIGADSWPRSRDKKSAFIRPLPRSVVVRFVLAPDVLVSKGKFDWKLHQFIRAMGGSTQTVGQSCAKYMQQLYAMLDARDDPLSSTLSNNATQCQRLVTSLTSDGDATKALEALAYHLDTVARRRPQLPADKEAMKSAVDSALSVLSDEHARSAPESVFRSVERVRYRRPRRDAEPVGATWIEAEAERHGCEKYYELLLHNPPEHFSIEQVSDWVDGMLVQGNVTYKAMHVGDMIATHRRGSEFSKLSLAPKGQWVKHRRRQRALGMAWPRDTAVAKLDRLSYTKDIAGLKKLKAIGAAAGAATATDHRAFLTPEDVIAVDNDCAGVLLEMFK